MTAPGVEAREAKGFRIAVTDGWWDLPLDPSTRDAEIEALVAESRPDARPELRRQIVEILTRTATAAESLGAGLCSEYAALDEEGNLIAANLLVTEAPTRLVPDDPTGCAAALAEPAAALAERAAAMAEEGFPGPADPPPTECSVVDLPAAGPAIRVRSDVRSGHVNSPAPGPASLRLQFFVPTPGTGTTTVVTFSASMVTGAEPEDTLVEFFDAMAETFSFVDAQGERIAPTG